MIDDALLRGLLLGASVLTGYLFGSFPSGEVITRRALKGQRLNKIGSGGTGATNVLRSVGKAAAVATLVADSVKGVLAILLVDWGLRQLALSAERLEDLPLALAALAAVLGHCFPPWRLQFKGGKGTATGIGVLAYLAPQVALVALGIWLATVAATRISSMGSLVACPIIVLWLLWKGTAPLATTLALSMCAVVILLRHRANIQRLIKGQEPKIGERV